MRTIEPWLINPSLTEDRLRIIGNEIVQVRTDAVAEYRSGKDSPWCLGCRAYTWTCDAITRLALSGRHPWLTVRQQGLRFRLLVDGLPIKFYRGNAEKPSSRSLRRNLEDILGQEKFAFVENTSNEGWFWLIAIETKDDGTVSRVVMIQANDSGDVRNPWEIPLEVVANARPVPSAERQPVDLPAPSVTSKKKRIKEKADLNNNAETGA